MEFIKEPQLKDEDLKNGNNKGQMSILHQHMGCSRCFTYLIVNPNWIKKDTGK